MQERDWREKEREREREREEEVEKKEETRREKRERERREMRENQAKMVMGKKLAEKLEALSEMENKDPGGEEKSEKQ